ncbi:MAG: hypothetical protein KGD63_07485 [Candidatus Lokiarchaeota archaeon]|nr:hypothetical protein [Candidatus Lokiarchaeota archaeon]
MMLSSLDIEKITKLCDIPYKHSSIKNQSIKNGWKIIPLEKWENDKKNSFLRIAIPDYKHELWICLGIESIAGIPLATLEDDLSEMPSNRFHRFQALFFHYLKKCDKIGLKGNLGRYYSNDLNSYLNYIIYQRKNSKLILIEHDEGDANYGHIASLDLRIIPGKDSKLKLPLKTNLIF